MKLPCPPPQSAAPSTPAALLRRLPAVAFSLRRAALPALLLLGCALATPAAQAQTTLLSDDFASGTLGASPAGWTVTNATSATCTVQYIPGSSTDKCMKFVDTHTTNAASAERGFTAQTSSVTAEWGYYDTHAGGATDKVPYFQLRSGATVAIDLWRKGAELGYNEAGTNKTVGSAFTANTWQAVQVVANVTAKTFTVYINGVAKLTNKAFSNTSVTSIDTIRFATAGPIDTCYIDNVVISGAGTAQVAAPAFSPEPGTYSSTTTVGITTATSGATIRYTTDGSTPTAISGTVYSTAISLSSTTTLKAIAYKSGMTDSTVTSGDYTITLPQVEAPDYGPGGGTYSSAQTVTITSATSGASIRYTTDGSDPTSAVGTLYSTPVNIATSTVLKSIAYKSGMRDSLIMSDTYTITAPGALLSDSFETGTIGTAPAGWTVTTASGATLDVQLRPGSSTDKAMKFTDTSATNLASADRSFTAQSTKVTASFDYYDTHAAAATEKAPYIQLRSGTTVAVEIWRKGLELGYNEGGTNKSSGGKFTANTWQNVELIADLATKTYSVIINGTPALTNKAFSNASVSSIGNIRFATAAPVNTSYFDNVEITTDGGTTVEPPSFSPAGGTYSSAQTVTLASGTSGASIRYTTDGSTPTSTSGTVYVSPVTVSSTTTLKAIAYKSGMTDSLVTAATYTINGGQVAPPAFSPAGGTYTTVQSVTITTSTAGATIRYTTNGSTPSATAGTIYSTPVNLSASATLKAIAYKSGMTDSTVTSAAYTINLTPVATPTFSPAPGSYASAQTVTIATTTSGASLRYTLDGTTPTTTTGTIYSGPVSVAATSTLKAIGYKSGMADSTVASGTYTIGGSISYISVTTHGATANDSSDDTDEILAAFAAAASQAKGVSFPSGIFRVSSELTIPDDLRDILMAADTTIIQSSLTDHLLRKKGSVNTTRYDITGGTTKGSTQITVSNAAGLAVNDWFNFGSDDQMHPNKHMGFGFLRKITAINGNTLTLDRALHRTMTNVDGDPHGATDGITRRGYKVTLAKSVKIQNGILKYATPLQNHWEHPVRMDFVENPEVIGTQVTECGGSGFTFFGTVGGKIDGAFVNNLMDDNTANHYGYGISLHGSVRDLVVTNTRVVGGRHAFSTNEAAGGMSSVVNRYGEPENIEVTMTVTDSSSSALDTHEPGYDIRFVNCLIIRPGAKMRSGIISGKYAGFGFETRSRKTSFINCEVNRSADAGFNILEPSRLAPWGVEDAAIVTNCTVLNVEGGKGAYLKQAAIVDGLIMGPGQNTNGIIIQTGGVSSTIKNSDIDMTNNANHITGATGATTLQNNTLH